MTTAAVHIGRPSEGSHPLRARLVQHCRRARCCRTGHALITGLLPCVPVCVRASLLHVHRRVAMRRNEITKQPLHCHWGTGSHAVISLSLSLLISFRHHAPYSSSFTHFTVTRHAAADLGNTKMRKWHYIRYLLSKKNANFIPLFETLDVGTTCWNDLLVLHLISDLTAAIGLGSSSASPFFNPY